MEAQFPCVHVSRCDGPHTEIHDRNFTSSVNPRGLVLFCSLLRAVYAIWAGTTWQEIPGVPAQFDRIATTQDRPASSAVDQPNIGRFISARLPFYTRAAASRSTSGIGALYQCPDCRRPAAKKCAMDVRRCIRHCTAVRCSASGHQARLHAEIRPAVLNQPRIIEIELTATSPVTNMTLFTTRVFHVANTDYIDLKTLPQWMVIALRLPEVNRDSTQWLDPTIEDPILAWRQAFDSPIGTLGADCVLLRASAWGPFPSRWVVDMADGLQAAAARLSNDPTYDARLLFTEAFPGRQVQFVDEFIAAVYLWADLPSSVRDAGVRAGRTLSGEWQTILSQVKIGDQL